jgi:hypothetical protein
VGGEIAVVLVLGHILRRRHASTPHYRPTILCSDIQEGIEVAGVYEMAGVALYIGRT